MKNKPSYDAVREIAITFLYLDFVPTKIPALVKHPFTDSIYVNGLVAGRPKILDLSKEDESALWRKDMKTKILSKGFRDICSMLNPVYFLSFLKRVECYVSPDDIGYALRDHWTHIECISTDQDLKGPEVIRLFTKASPQAMMDDMEQSVFYTLPEQVTIYRGVTAYNSRHKKAVSWTLNRQVAVRFANRFHSGTGEVWTLTVPKSKILCCFLKRAESEVIVDLYREKYEIKIEKQEDKKE